MKKTLLFSSSGPGTSGVGGVLIKDMLANPGLGSVALLALLSPDHARQIDSTGLTSRHVLEPVDDYCPPATGGLRQKITRHLARLTSYGPRVRHLADRAANLIADEQPEQVWAILNSVLAIDVLHRLLPRIRCDLLVQIWDDPMHLAAQRNLDRIMRRRLDARFQDILRRATRTAVIGEEMAEAYQARQPGNYVIVRHGVVEGLVTPRRTPSSSSEFRIGLSGSLYCPSAWRCLQKALDRMDWRLDDRQVVLVVLGGKADFVSRGRAEARFYGWRSPEESMALMAECDLLYLPQAFEGARRELTTLSFPTKLSAYAATGRPVLVHTPEYGSLNRFCREQDAGIVCHTTDADDMAGILRRCADRTYLTRQAEAMSRVGSEVLNKQQFQDAVHRFLVGISPQTD